jgi:hypothetical protein
MLTFHKDMTLPTKPNSLFVFGSNLAGRHGAGSARYALDHCGAVYGVFSGPTGQAYAVPTVDSNIMQLPLEVVELYVNQLIQYSLEHYDTTFFVTRIGCGIAGFTDEQIANLFFGKNTLHNFDLPEEWKQYHPDQWTL